MNEEKFRKIAADNNWTPEEIEAELSKRRKVVKPIDKPFGENNKLQDAKSTERLAEEDKKNAVNVGGVSMPDWVLPVGGILTTGAVLAAAKKLSPAKPQDVSGRIDPEMGSSSKGPFPEGVSALSDAPLVEERGSVAKAKAMFDAIGTHNNVPTNIDTPVQVTNTVNELTDLSQKIKNATSPSAVPNIGTAPELNGPVKPPESPVKPVTPNPIPHDFDPTNPGQYPQGSRPEVVKSAIEWAKANPEQAAKLAAENKAFLPDALTADNHLHNSYGKEGRLNVLNKFNEGKPIGAYDNIKMLDEFQPSGKSIKDAVGVQPPQVNGVTSKHGRLGIPAALEDGKLFQAGMKANGELNMGTVNSKLSKGAAAGLILGLPMFANAMKKGNYGEAGKSAMDTVLGIAPLPVQVGIAAMGLNRPVGEGSTLRDNDKLSTGDRNYLSGLAKTFSDGAISSEQYHSLVNEFKKDASKRQDSVTRRMLNPG